MASKGWGHIRIITGTILGGILGFYVMHRLETRSKEKMQERINKYESEIQMRELQQLEGQEQQH